MSKPTKKMTAKKLSAFISEVYKVHSQGLRINILDIGKVFRAGEAAYALSGESIDAERAVIEQIEKLCVPA